MECGTRLEIRKKLKKVRNAALKIVPIYMLSHWLTRLVSIGISIIDLMCGLKEE